VIVVDSNVIAYLYLPGEFTSAAEALLERDPEWIAPALWRSELRNILTGYVRRELMTLEQAVAIQREAEALLAPGEADVDSGVVLGLAAQSGCTAYDCEFVALAKAFGISLVTMDKALLSAFSDVAQPLIRPKPLKDLLLDPDARAEPPPAKRGRTAARRAPGTDA